FTVNLPLAIISDNGSLSLTPKRFDSEDLSGVKVLVVDDEPDARELIKRILTHCQASVTAAATASEGLELLANERPDIVISDIGMPEKSGYQFMREVRNLPAESGGKTPAIAVTAFARAEDKISAINAVYQEYLTKPVEPRELIDAICKLAGREEELEDRNFRF
ncbi:MAG: response regulator, partial [Nitrosospira sp.]|nr:response regulator [Nitrosospira sp.]